MKGSSDKKRRKLRRAKKNREYKDSVFVDLFSIDKKTRLDASISLYNALHKEKISEKDDVRFVRLVNILFCKVRNDVSFVVNNRLLILVEHQSTINENITFRFLEYIVAIYSSVLNQRDKFLRKAIELYAPEFYVIYNGKADYPARKELRLSNLFKESAGGVSLELVVNSININHPENKDFLESCPTLKGYQQLVEKCEKYFALNGESGYIKAIEECINQGILSEYLKRRMREVAEMFSAEYSYKLELEASKRDGIEIGRAEGIQQGMRSGIQQGMQQGMHAKALETAKELLSMGLSVSDIMRATALSKDEIEKL